MRDVIMQIREEMKPLAKLDGTPQYFYTFQSPYLGMINLIYIGSTELLDVAKGVRETLVEFQTQVVQALRK